MTPGRDVAFLVVADARIDDDAATSGVDHERMHAHDQPPFRRHEVRFQPLNRSACLGCRIGQNELCATRNFEFHDTCDFYAADLPLIHADASATTTQHREST